MLTERSGVQLKMHCITLEDLVPDNHFLRKLEAAVDFSFIYDMVRDLYCENNGRPCIDPVALIKYLLLGYLYGIESERQIEEHCRERNPFRWFLGIDIDERVPDHSTISQNRRRRFNGENIFRQIFENVLRQCIEKGLVDGKIILTDSTHVKANASFKKNIKIIVEREASDYMKRLDEYEAEERARLESSGAIKPKATRKKKAEKTEVTRTVNTTDPDAGMLNRPGKPRGMHYLSHQSIDAANGIVVDVSATPGNENDSGPYLQRIEYMRDELGFDIETACADSAYGTSMIYHALDEMGIALHTPGTTGGVSYKAELGRDDFEYDKERDCFICPMGKKLRLRNLERETYNVCRVYGAAIKDCKLCLMTGKCLSASQHNRRIRVNIFEDSVKHQREKGVTPLHKHILKLRQIWCEGSFAAQKWGHNLKRLLRRGLKAAEEHCLLSATALNLKRMIKCLG